MVAELLTLSLHGDFPVQFDNWSLRQRWYRSFWFSCYTTINGNSVSSTTIFHPLVWQLLVVLWNCFSLTKLTELRAQCLKKHQKCLMILIISLLRVQMLLAVMKYETLQVIFKHCVEDGNRVYQENYRFHGNFAEILTGSFQSCWSPFFFSSLSLCQNIYLRQANDRSHQSSTNFLHFIMEPFHPQLFFS